MFSINPSSGVPIYRQIVDQARQLAAAGHLAEGDSLPSVRAIAKELGINPMTVSKAYSLLEAEGVLTRKRGVGMVINKGLSKPEGAIESPLAELVMLAKRLGLNERQLQAKIRKLWRES